MLFAVLEDGVTEVAMAMADAAWIDSSVSAKQ